MGSTPIAAARTVPGPVRALLAAVLFGATALIALHDWAGLLGPGFDRIAGGHLYDAVVIAAGIACLLRARAVPRERSAWLLIGAAVLAWAAGESYWTLYILDDPSPPYPSGADALYIAFYPLVIAGLALLIRARAEELEWRRWFDGAIAALGTAALGAAFVFEFLADRSEGSSLEVATSLAYPLGDILTLAIVVGVVALTDWRPGRTWSLLLAGIALQAIADIAYSLQETGGVVPPGNWIDPIYLISAAVIGSVLWAPAADRIRTASDGGRWRELMVPILFMAMMAGLYALHQLGATGDLAEALWGATLVAVIVRLAVSVRENRVLLAQVRTDALTGLGNRGAMQVDLEALVARAHAGEPAAVYLFDLNGFKRYNDTFGHPAGDELLRAFGRRLSDAAGADGTVYRIGGDEFCAMLTCPPEQVAGAAKRMAEALSTRDRGVEVTTAWGGAAVPAEAEDAAAALQLADVRMYAQKESRRLAGPERGDQRVEGAPDLDPHTLGVLGPGDEHRRLV